MIRRQVPRSGAAVQACAVHPRGRAGPRPPRRRQAAQQPRAAVPEPGDTRLITICGMPWKQKNIH